MRLATTVAAVTILQASSLLAQSASGTFLGVARDASGAVVSNAAVAIVNRDTGFRRELNTNELGEYEAPYMPLGTYTLTAKAAGFRAVERAGINLQVDQKVRVDFTLAVGDVAETITVTEAPPMVKADSSEFGDVIQKRQVQELPLNGRNYVQLVHLQAGVTTGQQGGNIEGAGAFVPRGTGSFNANGQRGQNNNFLVDGIDNNESWINSTILQPSVEATQEFKVYVANAPAEFGRASGGIVNVQIRNGTNELHGSVYDYLRNSALDARDFFQRKTAQNQRRIPAFRQNQFGATFGGPAIKNNWFFFGDYQGLRQGRGLNVISNVPTAAQKTGDFGATQIFDPLTTRPDPAAAGQFVRTPFADNRVPAARIPRPARLLTNLYPDPNVGTGQFFFSPNRLQNDDAFNIRSDKVIAPNKNNLFARVSRGRNFTDLPGAMPRPANPGFTMGAYAGGDTAQLADAADFRLTTWGGVINDTHIIRSNLLADVRFGFSRFDLFAVPKDMNINSAQELGIPGVNEAVPPFSGGLPAIRPAGFAFLGANTPIPSVSVNTNYQLSGNLTWIKGRHSWKTGWQTVRRHLNFFESQDPARGFFNFNAEFTNNTRGAGGSPIASLLLGYPTQISRATLFGTFGLRGSEHAWFIQDDFKVNRRLTLNLGLRHEIFMPLTEVAGRLANFNFDRANPAPNLIPALGGDKYAGRKTDPNNFAPRVGFAYSLRGNGRTVVRGSYGLHYVSVHYAGQGALGRNVPFMPIQFLAPGSLNVGRNLTDGLPIPRFRPLTTAAEVQAAAIAGDVGQIQAVDRDTKFSYSQQWGLNIQHELAEGLLVDVGYLGSRGINLFSSYNLNQADPGPGAIPPRRPWQPISQIANLNFLGYFGASVYHGGLFKLQKSWKSGTSVNVVYTFAKSIDDSISGSSGQTSRSGGYQNINDRRSARAPSTFDIASRFVLSGVWELPFGKGRAMANGGGAMDALVGGWQLNSIATFQSGLPLTPTMAASNLNNGGAYQLPNRVCEGSLPVDQRSISRWFDTSCFVAPPAFTYGNSGLNILRGPGLAQVDLAMLKNFALPGKEGLRLQFRAEAFNIANRANFRQPNFNIGVPASATITNTVTGFGRQIQLVLKVEF